MAEHVITIDGESRELELQRDGSLFRTGEHEIGFLSIRGSEVELRVRERTCFVPFIVDGTEVSFAYGGEIWTVDVAGKGARKRVRHSDHSLSAPMPGVVLKILVAVGDEVAKGAPLLILEAMKMEHPITSPRDGTVAAIHCKEGEMVQPGLDLVTIA